MNDHITGQSLGMTLYPILLRVDRDDDSVYII